MKKAMILVLLIFILAGSTSAQVLPGASFLRTTPGARLHAMGGAGAAGLDGVHTIYANPGLTGFMREGLWSATFTSWIADVYNASFIYGRRVRTPLSRWSRISLGLFYQGMKEFDSTDGAAPLATANDLIVDATFGLPLTAISHGLSAGVGGKYFHSNLDYFSANAFIFDAGLFYRTPRFNMPLNGFGIFREGVVSTGVSVINLGGDLQYISVGTPLPRAFRGGLSLNAGTHHGLQTQFSLDYIKFRDEDSGLRFGVELSWNRLFALSGGYQNNQGLLDQATFGLSVNLDNFSIPVGVIMPETASALRLDIATQNEREFFSRTYRGSASHYSIGPEAFHLSWPEQNAFYEHDSLVFTWEPSRDPDLYDDVFYHLLADHDSTKVARLLEKIHTQRVLPSQIKADGTFIVNQTASATSFELQDFPGGHYFWAVVAYDKDEHPRMAKQNGDEIAHFYVPRPDLIVEKIEHDYYDKIDTTDYQGKIHFVIKNQGEMAAKNIHVALSDSVLSPAGNLVDSTIVVQYADFTIPDLQADASQELTYEWHRATLGACNITITPDSERLISELDDENNAMEKLFYTVPKGTFETASDTSLALLTSRVVVELPFINQVNFGADSASIRKYYVENVANFDATLLVLAQRLEKSPSLKVRLVGYADENSDTGVGYSDSTAALFSGMLVDVKKGKFVAKSVAVNSALETRLRKKSVLMPDPLFHLAYSRAEAVKNAIVNMKDSTGASVNVLPKQVAIDSIFVWKKRTFSANAEQADKDMLLEERREVDILASKSDEKVLFEPVMKTDDEPVRDDVLFDSRIVIAAPVTKATINFSDSVSGGDWTDTAPFSGDSLFDTIHWKISKIPLPLLKKIIGKENSRKISYDISLTDVADRVFYNDMDMLVFNKKFRLRQHRISFPLKFGQAKLLYGDYWNRIYTLGDSLLKRPEGMRLKFQGHSCVIGGDIGNYNLSVKRAGKLKSAYFKWVSANHGGTLAFIKKRTDTLAEGKGEMEPLQIHRIKPPPILIGDNNKAIGRKFNRRIEIIYYNPLFE